MKKIKRKSFLKMGALAMLSPFANNMIANAAPTVSPGNELPDGDLLNRMVVANDKQVALLLQSIQSKDLRFSRRIGNDFGALSAAYCHPASNYYHNPLLIAKLEILTAILERYQTQDGTVNIGNLESPPDTAFLIELLTVGATLLQKDNSTETIKVRAELKNFLLRSGEALAIGGVHTPNHRWVISAALAKLNALYPNKKYTERIEDWLDEGVFIDSDGHYPERSGIYSGVENTAFITMARLLKKPELLEVVRKNLSMLCYYIEPNGDLVTTDSRRQDQYMTISVFSMYMHYRYMAIEQKNSQFAGVVQFIESLPGFDKAVIEKELYHFMEEPIYQQALPPASPLPSQYEKFFATTNLLRIKNGQTTATLFGGIDWPIIIASGRSNSPNFFSFRKGNAIMKYARVSSGFFAMGYFYSDGIKKEGNNYVLYKKLEVPYYQPIPKKIRNQKGDYKLSPSIDDRFWNKMDFENRPVSNVKQLETKITLVPSNNSKELHFQVTGLSGVPVTIELCFGVGGKLSGVTTTDNNNYFLEEGIGKYEMGGDTIEFGPGAVAGKEIGALEGERYTTHFGTLKTDGMRVFITGITPFDHKLVFS